MSLPTVHQDSLISLSSIMNDTNSIFIIPTFQRPFAWEKEQLQDLHEDIKNTIQILSSAPVNIHYLAPIHLIPFKASDRDNSMLKAYLPKNNDIDELLKSLNDSGKEFINDKYQTLNVYFVIDGQQRLTTLFFVYQFIYKSWSTNPLYVSLLNKNVIPRLIQNPSDDHIYFVTLLKSLGSLTTLPESNTQAQKRMYKAVEYIETWNDWTATSSTDFTKFLHSSAMKSLLIELETNYGLTSFQILNDRGKGLTALEKFKSLMFEYDLNYNSGVLTHKIHSIFSNLYQLLDEGTDIDSGLFPEGKAGDDRLMQYILTYIRINQHADNYWQSGDNAYEILRKELISATNKSTILTNWFNKIQEIYQQLKHLNDCLLGKEPTVKNPSFICKGRKIQDDYKIIIRSLGLSSRSIAVMIKFRTLYKAEWHDRFPMDCICNPDLLKSLSVHLDQIRGKTKNMEIHKQIGLLDMPSCGQTPSSYHCEYSMLQIVERMELLIWQRYNPQGRFRDKWNAVFSSSHYTAENTIAAWYSWYYTENDFPRLIQDDGYKTETIFRYILREYEGYLNKGVNIHFDTDLTLEHIFPQTPAPNPPVRYGFTNDYDRFLNRSGNLTFVYKNESLSNQLPDIKASRYLKPITAKGLTKNQPEITRRIGNQLLPLTTDYLAYQESLRVRCTELAIFSLKRFFCE